jgi:hypothetical protein
MKTYSVLEGYLGDLFDEYANYYDGVILADAKGGLVFHYSSSEGAAGVLASPAAVWEAAAPSPPTPATPRAIVVADSESMKKEFKRQALAGERLAKRIEELGLRLQTTWSKTEAARLHATQDSLIQSLHETIEPDELSRELAIVFSTLPALADLNIFRRKNLTSIRRPRPAGHPRPAQQGGLH